MKIVVQDILTNYLEDGAAPAPAVLLLHGWGAEVHNFDGLAQGLCGRFRVLRLDLPGFGGTERPRSAWHIQDYAVYVAAFLQKVGVGELAAVAGHSFGGRVVLKGLAENVIPAKKVILIDSAGLKPARSLRHRAYQGTAKAGRAVLGLPGLSSLAPGLRRRLYESAGSTDYLNSGAMKEIFLNAINEDQTGDAKRVAVPALLIWGAEDTDTPQEDGRTLANLIPTAQLSILAGAGHFAHNDAPDRTLRLIEEFLG